MNYSIVSSVLTKEILKMSKNFLVAVDCGYIENAHKARIFFAEVKKVFQCASFYLGNSIGEARKACFRASNIDWNDELGEKVFSMEAVLGHLEGLALCLGDRSMRFLIITGNFTFMGAWKHGEGFGVYSPFDLNNFAFDLKGEPARCYGFQQEHIEALEGNGA
jgi:hypothetical protein